MGVGELMAYELEEELKIPVQVVAIDELASVLDKTTSATVVTSRYFINDVEAIAAPKAIRVIPLDIYDYNKEINLLKTLPKDNCVGIVSLSSGIGRQAEVILHGLRGDELLVMTAQPKDNYKMQAIVKRAEVIICDQACYATVQAAVQAASEDIIRPPKLIKVENYIGTNSINLLKRELGLG
jgi:GntR family transcriptional regulator